MAKILDLTRDGISYNIKILKEKGMIERIGSTKNGIWKINKEWFYCENWQTSNKVDNRLNVCYDFRNYINN